MKEWQTRTLAVTVLGLASLAFAGPVAAKELSEKSVRVLMEYAWTILPAKFTTPDGKVKEVNNKAGGARVNPAVPSHIFENIGKNECQQVLVERKK